MELPEQIPLDAGESWLANTLDNLVWALLDYRFPA